LRFASKRNRRVACVAARLTKGLYVRTRILALVEYIDRLQMR